MGDIRGADEQPTEPVENTPGGNAEPKELVDNATTESIVKMQHCIITLADGRRGVFMGPELIKDVEMKLGLVPKLVSVDFDPPRAVAVPIPRETPPVEETPNADSQTESKPAAGLE